MAHGSTRTARDAEAGAATDGPTPGVSTPIPPTSHVAPVIPGYEIVGELGRGGMGVVYKARQVRLNRTVALKMILAGDHADARGRRPLPGRGRGRRPAPAPEHRPDLRDRRADGLPYLALEYVRGRQPGRTGSTARPGRRGGRRRLVEALARGVAEAHRLGIVHRDLKPANILLTADGTPKVTDFGLAKLLDVESGLTADRGGPGHAQLHGPRAGRGQGRGSRPAADVYALGAILYELLTGRPPFRGATVLETLQQVRRPSRCRRRGWCRALPRDLETIA